MYLGGILAKVAPSLNASLYEMLQTSYSLYTSTCTTESIHHEIEKKRKEKKDQMIKSRTKKICFFPNHFPRAFSGGLAFVYSIYYPWLVSKDIKVDFSHYFLSLPLIHVTLHLVKCFSYLEN